MLLFHQNSKIQLEFYLTWWRTYTTLFFLSLSYSLSCFVANSLTPIEMWGEKNQNKNQHQFECKFIPHWSDRGRGRKKNNNLITLFNQSSCNYYYECFWIILMQWFFYSNLSIQSNSPFFHFDIRRWRWREKSLVDGRNVQIIASIHLKQLVYTWPWAELSFAWSFSMASNF